MDGLSFHPYPNSATDALSTGYPWPNAGFVNLDRVKQAALGRVRRDGAADDARGAPPVPRRDRLAGRHARRRGSHGVENVPVTTESHQAEVYAEVVRLAACDPDIAQVNIFGFRDDTSRAGFQAGLQRADGTPRASADAVRDALASRMPAPSPSGSLREPSSAPRGPEPRWSRGQLRVELTAAEGATARACLLPGSHTLHGAPRARARAAPSRGRAPRVSCRRIGSTTLRHRPAGRPADARRPARRRDECGARDDHRAADSLRSGCCSNMRKRSTFRRP